MLVSGGTADDPHTPPGLPGLPAPFLGVAVVGSGGRTAAVDAYGDVVDLRAPGPAGRPLAAVTAKRQQAGTVAAGEAIVARARLRDGRTPPLWRADAVEQRYVPGTNVLRTVARFRSEKVVVVRQIGGDASADRHWLARARPLATGAPGWARRMYSRSLLVLRALTDRRTGAVAAGARDAWAYVWPRDASAVAIALAAAGYRPTARRIVGFLRKLDLGAAARFRGTGAPVEGREDQGDAQGWVAAAARAAGVRAPTQGFDWRRQGDYQEGGTGDYLGNAIASDAALSTRFATPRGLVREADDPNSGLDSSAAWAVRPFPRPALFPIVRKTLLQMAAGSSRFGIVPSEDWEGGSEPWTAPTAWAAWSLGALGERRAALHLMAALRRAATPLGLLPERVDARTGLPVSTTPLAWSHAFAILALRELWPSQEGSKPAAG